MILPKYRVCYCARYGIMYRWNLEEMENEIDITIFHANELMNVGLITFNDSMNEGMTCITVPLQIHMSFWWPDITIQSIPTTNK